jgi:hypothetical protein
MWYWKNIFYFATNVACWINCLIFIEGFICDAIQKSTIINIRKTIQEKEKAKQKFIKKNSSDANYIPWEEVQCNWTHVLLFQYVCDLTSISHPLQPENKSFYSSSYVCKQKINPNVMNIPDKVQGQRNAWHVPNPPYQMDLQSKQSGTLRPKKSTHQILKNLWQQKGLRMYPCIYQHIVLRTS